MVDCHIHMVLDGQYWRDAIRRHSTRVDREFVHKALGVYRDAGYTYLRDGGDRWGVGAYAREVASAYGIVYRTPLAPLSKKGHYGGFIGLQWETPREFAQLVQCQKQRGCDFLKIMVSGLMDFNQYGVLTEVSLSKKEILELVHIGKEEGLAVMAHCNGAAAIRDCAEAGVDSIEHGAYPDAESLDAMCQCGTVWVPTLATYGNLRGKGRFEEKAVCAILERMSEQVVAFSRMGGLVALGSDAGAWAVPHGCGSEQAYLEALGVDWKPGSEKIRGIF